MQRVVAVSGVGTVGSYGCGLERLSDALREGVPRLADVALSIPYAGGARAQLAALTERADLSPWVSPAEGRRMSPPSKLAVAAARMAVADAGLPLEAVPDLTAVVIATTFGPASFSERLYKTILEEGPESASPALFTECVANAPAAQIAINCRAKGPNVTIAQREAGALIALSRGSAEVASGRASCALVGCVDEMTPLVHAILDRFGSLARASRDRPERPRPFDLRRNGFLASEGATVLVLEEERAVTARGGRVLARVVASSGAFDATASRVGWGQGEATLGKALSRLLARAGRPPQCIDRIVSGANGSIAGDRLEGRVLMSAWAGAPLPPVLAPKGVTGEYGGGFLAALALGVLPGPCGPTAGFCDADLELGVVPHQGGELPPPRNVLASVVASGGAAAWVILEAA